MESSSIMADAQQQGRRLLSADTVLPILVVGILFILLFPMPPILLDLLLVLNISIAMLVLLLMFYVSKPMELSSFPAMLLVLTLFRLALNVASTKLILLDAKAGSVIDAFGKFVIRDNYVIGVVVFLILIMIQFIVITRGAGRIAEVSARFTLDAMPGKQMSIDADLNAGMLTEDEARARRQEIADEAEFYGAMDGANKFVRGDAMAGLVITAINIIGGLAIGMWQKGMELTTALETFTILTIGDGLVSQIPALFIAVAAGMLVTKSASKNLLGTMLAGQLLKRPEPVFTASLVLMFLGILPGLPFVPFAAMSVSSFVIAMYLKNVEKTVGSETIEAVGGGALPGGAKAENALPGPVPEPEGPTQISPMTLEIGFSLVPLVDELQDGDLVERISLIRKQIREELGFMIPVIQIQDNIELGNSEYRLLVRGLEKARGHVYPGSMLAIDPGGVSEPIEGVQVKDPAFGFEAVWISATRADAAEGLGYTVVDAASVITTHVTKVVREHAADLLSRQDVSDMLDELKKTDSAVIEELIPNQLGVGVVHRVLQALLAEMVPIHDLASILEILSDYAPQTKDPMLLGEFCRQAMKGHIISRCLSEDGILYAVTLDPELEEELRASVTQATSGGMLSLSPERAMNISNSITEAMEEARQLVEAEVILLVSPVLRMHLFRLLERKIPDLTVVSFAEVDDEVSLEIVGSISADSAVEETVPQ
jgi:flagellar biosynthesis protein FlhA